MHADNWSTKHRRTFACLLLLVVVSSHLPKTSAAASASPWLTADPHRMKLGVVEPTDTLVPSMITNRDCQPSEIITRPSKVLPPQSQQSHDSCIVDTGFGAVSESGFLQRQGSDTFGLLRSQSGSPAVVGIPRTNNAMVTLGSAPHGAYIGFYDNLSRLVTTSSFNGIVTHTLPATPSATLTDHAGHQLGAELSSLSFSEEGDWAVVEIPSIAMVRINTTSHEVLPFAAAPETSIGTSYRTAISADGHYAVVISKTRSMFTLYDLSTCGSIPATITTNVTCASTDLLPYMQRSITDYSSVASVRFRGEYSLELYINTASNILHYLITAAGQEPAKFAYLALGDSFASGEGAYQYKSLTDTTDNTCHLSLRSYPYLITRQLQLGRGESVACSGALMADITNNNADYKLHNSQAKGKEDVSFDESIFSGFLVGYRAQKVFAKKYDPEVMTVSIGGNDIGFSDIIIRCLGPDTCYSKYEDRLELLNEVSDLFPRLSSTYTTLKQSSPSSLKIYSVGYPELVDTSGNCALNVHLNHEEALLANSLVDHLNSVIKAAADQAGVTFLDTTDALHGHRLCETNSNGVAVNGLTVGNDVLDFLFVHGPIAKESYHPNSLGHELLTSKILTLTNNFEVLNKAPQPQTKTVSPDTNTPALKIPKADRPLKKTIHKKSSNSTVAKKSTKRKTTYKSAANIFKPGSTPTVVLDGDGSSVGTVTLNPDDTIDVEIIPPGDIPDGPHTVDIIGDNNSDEPVDVTETIVVGDTSGPCGVFSASGVDADADGVDDACDSLISSGAGDGSSGVPGSTVNTGEQPASDEPANTPSTVALDSTNPLSTPATSTLLQLASQTPTTSTIPTLSTSSLAVQGSPTKQTIAVTQQTTPLPQVKAAQATQSGKLTSDSSVPYPPASYYKSPRKLDFVRIRSLFFILFILLLLVSYVVYKKRKDQK